MNALVRIMTSEGRGAIAVVRVRGEDAVSIADTVFRPAVGKSLAESSAGRLRVGRAGLGQGDEVVAVRLDTAIPTVEIQCHGGAAAVASVVAALQAAGARRWESDGLDPGSGDDPIATQALDDLSRATTLRTAEVLLDQAQGALRQELVRLSSDLECGAGSPLTRLDELIQWAAVGLRLIPGWTVVIAGRPNVGKSRLFNALVGFARAIVDPTPGVTRDVVTFPTAFGGWPVELADTAGLRRTGDAVESIGIDRARRAQERADLVLLVLDRSEALQPEDRELIAWHEGAMLVANKADLPAAWDPRELSRELQRERQATAAYEVRPARDPRGLNRASTAIAMVSAESGEGIAELIAAIVDRLVPDPPTPGDAVPFRADHLDALVSARADLLAGDPTAAARRLAAIDGVPPSSLPDGALRRPISGAEPGPIPGSGESET
jgi:tRNA modification GTPase